MFQSDWRDKRTNKNEEPYNNQNYKHTGFRWSDYMECKIQASDKRFQVIQIISKVRIIFKKRKCHL